MFARQGQEPIKVSHRAHTSEETRCAFRLYFYSSHLLSCRAHIARWCAESNRPHRIVKDRQFDSVSLKAGRRRTSLPSLMTVSRNTKAAFEHCRERIDAILKVGLRICIMDCLFNICIGTLRACTFCNRCMNISIITARLLLGPCICTTMDRSWFFFYFDIIEVPEVVCFYFKSVCNSAED